MSRITLCLFALCLVGGCNNSEKGGSDDLAVTSTADMASTATIDAAANDAATIDAATVDAATKDAAVASADLTPQPPDLVWHPDLTGELCSSLMLPPAVTQRLADGDAPTPAGGAIAEGAYELTDYAVYGGTTLTSDDVRGALHFLGGIWEGRSSQVLRRGLYKTDGTTLKRNYVCGCFIDGSGCEFDGDVAAREYSATSTTLLIFAPYVNGGTAVSTYTKQ